ncbi:MAG TPA: hypothetical protein VFE88_02430 [Candidatus Nanoarchaeia archaeon]|nr:hypothetical protein [Candidatus Nanoarchaeia archaeon]
MNEKAKEIKALVELAFKQDERNFLLVLRNIKEKIKAYKLKKNPLLKDVAEKLERVKDVGEAAVLMDELLKRLNQNESEPSEVVVEFYPEFVTASREALIQIQNGIKNKKVIAKLRFLLENLENQSFLRARAHSYPHNNKVDLICLGERVAHGVVVRVLYFVEGNKIRVCAFFVDHDLYERGINSGYYLKKNFENERWLRIPRF